ncbi:uncharacterized protein LOC131217068 isoform X2 [Magnolia sinica]|uniref:uncharacterized protein LOC131217068 isoform X2 n=1 Tax=Magnolia sinica TaxID=86752 RepID=UPI002657C2D9|nr:uncharacterized protein LOC131217068 isoform X2 [Magnolia sinica]
MLGPPEEPFQSLRRVPHMVEMSYCCLAGELQQFFVHRWSFGSVPVPTAVDCNRHCVIMLLVQGYPLVQVKQLENPDTVFDAIVGLVVCFAEHGLIHCDFNEFNIMINDNEEVTMIDFPQMLSVSHRNAQMYFDRDVECIYKFFSKREKEGRRTSECRVQEYNHFLFCFSLPFIPILEHYVVEAHRSNTIMS